MQSAVYAKGMQNTGTMTGRSSQRESTQRMPAMDIVQRRGVSDAASLNSLLLRCEGPVFRLAYRLTGNHDDAHDIAQEALLRIYSGIGALRDMTTLTAWVNRIVRNIVVDWYRSQCRLPTVSLDRLTEEQGEVMLLHAGHLAPPADICFEEKERNRHLNGMIDSLPDSQRRTIGLYVHEGRSYQEIAEILHISLGTVRSRVHRGRQAMGERVASERAAAIDW